jgi:hypothetical protein
MFNLFKKNNINLITYISDYGSYSCESKKSKSYEKILKNFKKNSNYTDYVSILSKFNKIYYPVYDIDNENKLNEYIETINKICDSFIVIRSGCYYNNNHYWIITDEPSNKISKILNNKIWTICNDVNYVDMCKKDNKIYIRGFYESNSKRPSIYKKYGNFSTNFSNFIDSIFKYYDTYGFEISVLKSRNEEFLPEIIARERAKKIKKINESL